MRVFWPKNAQFNFQNINKYLTVQFGALTSKKVRDKTFHFIELLQRFPQMGTLEVAEKNILGFQTTKQTRVFYRINKRHISLLSLFDNRHNPQKSP